MAYSLPYGMRRLIEYVMMTVLVLVCGSPQFTSKYIYAGLGLLSLVYLILSGKLTTMKKLWWYLLVYVVVFGLQFYMLGTISVYGSLNLMMRIIFGAVLMKEMGESFRLRYFNVLYFFSLVSLVLFFMQVMGYIVPNMTGPPYERLHSVIVYQCDMTRLDRNCGPFWEPGALAGYLEIAFVMYLDSLDVMMKKHPFKMGVLLFALLTTRSTTGYLVFAVIVFYFLIRKARSYRLLVYLVAIPAAIFVFYNIFSRVDFMRKKLDEQIESAEFETIGEEIEYDSNRFASLLFDMHYIRKHPIVGNGLKEETRYADNPELWGLALGHGNGFSNFLAQMGIIVFLLYFISIYRNLTFDKWDSLVFTFLIAMLLFGEQYLNYPLFLAMPFLTTDNEKWEERERKRLEDKRLRGFRYRSIGG